MNITLNHQVERFVHHKLEAEQYASVSELVNEALGLMLKRENRLAELKADIQIGIQQAEQNQLIDAETVFDRLQQRAMK